MVTSFERCQTRYGAGRNPLAGFIYKGFQPNAILIKPEHGVSKMWLIVGCNVSGGGSAGMGRRQLHGNGGQLFGLPDLLTHK